MDDRPQAPWGNFPLTEIVILLGIVLMAWGFLTGGLSRGGGSGGTIRFGAGLALASLAGLELAVREHVAGFRSHTTLLAGAAAFAVVTVLALGPGPRQLWILTLVAACVFAVVFWALRELFKRRSGGVAFR